jgi:hypothetical protein
MGAGEFEKLQTRTHATQFKESVRNVTGTDIKFLTPDIAVAHIKWGMRGDTAADGIPRRPRNGVMMQVLMEAGRQMGCSSRTKYRRPMTPRGVGRA